MPHLMLVLIPYIKLLNLSWIIKFLFLRNMEPLMLGTLGKTFSRRHFEIFLFFQKTGLDISCKLWETICMKCQNLFSVENKKNNISLLSAELAQRVVKVKGTECT